MNRNRKIVSISKLKDRIEGLVVNTRDITAGKKRKVIVTEENLPDTVPYIWIECIHPFYVLDGMLIGRIKSTYERIDSFLIFWTEFLVFFCYNRIGGAIIITLAVVIEIVFRSFSLMLCPLFRNRKSEHNGFLDI